MKKQLLSSSGSLLRFHSPPVTSTKQHNQQQEQQQQQQQQPLLLLQQQQQQRDVSFLVSPRASADYKRASVQLSPPLKLHVRHNSSLVHMLVSPTLSPRGTRSSISSITSNQTNTTSIDSATNSTLTSPSEPPQSPRTPSTPATRFSHSRTLSLPVSPMVSRRGWANRLPISFQSLASKRSSYSPAQSPLFDILEIPENNDYAAFESWEKSLRLYLGSQELEGSIDSGSPKTFTDAECLKAKKAIQLHVGDKLKMDIQRFDTPAEIFAFLKKLCLPVDGKELGDTMVKLATTKLSLETRMAQDVQILEDVAAVKKFNREFKGRLWALNQVGSPMADHAAASMYLGSVEKAFEAWRMSMLWMDLSLGILKLDSLMAMFEDTNNIKAWKTKGTAAGLLCWAENMGKDWSTGSLGSLGLLDHIPEKTSPRLKG